MKTFFLLIAVLSILYGCSKSSGGESQDKDSTVIARNLHDTVNIEYAVNKDTSGKQISLQLDLYYPAGASTTKKLPLVVLFHGGSYLNGDKSDINANCSLLADSGFVVASVNYRLGWRTGQSKCKGDTASQMRAAFRALQDANAALRYLTANASKYGVDINWVFIGGNSAGSSIALNTSYISDQIAAHFVPAEYALLGPVNSAGNSLTNSFQIKGICNMWGALPDSSLIYPGSALPTISFHGTNDDVIPYDIGYNESCPNYIRLYGSACIHRRLVASNVPVISNFIIGAGHEPQAYTHAFLMSNTSCFFHRVINKTPITSRIYTTLVSSCN